MVSTDQGWKELFPDNVAIQKVTTLTVNVFNPHPFDMYKRWEKVMSLVTQIITIFSQHVANLTLCNVPGALLEDSDATFPHLKSVSLQRILYLGYLVHICIKFSKFNVPLQKCYANVTKLEFYVPKDGTLDAVGLFSLLAPQLEHVCISSVPNIAETKTQWPHIVVPILPRLKVFEILREEIIYDCTTCNESNWFRPYLSLNFETGGDEVKLVYSKQFPAIEKLTVRVVRKKIPLALIGKVGKPDENFHFEATMLFLYETFLGEGVVPCETLRCLDISFPAEGKWNVGGIRRKRHCGWGEAGETSSRWGWVEGGTDIYERISTIFPNKWSMT